MMPRTSHWNPLLGKPRYDAWTRLNPSHPFNQGLVGYWLINEEAGTKCYDLANGYHGSYSGTPARSIAGGVAGLLPSTNNYVSVGDKTKLKITGAITLIADIWDNGTTRPQDYICGKVDSAWKYALWIDQGAQQVYIKFNTTDIPYPAISAGGGLNFMKGRWNRIIGTWNGVDTGICSVNGLRNSAAYSTALANDTDPFGIGARGGAGQPFNCPISFVAVYARGFSANEIREINSYPFGTSDNPCLITEPRRTWFVPSEEEAIELPVTNAESVAQVVALALTRIRGIAFTDVSVTTQVASVVATAIRVLTEQAVAASSSVVNDVLTRIKVLAEAAVSSSTSVGTVGATRTRPLTIGEVAAATQVVNEILVRCRVLGISPAVSESQIATITVNIIRVLSEINVESASQVMTVALSLYGTLNLPLIATMSDSQVTSLIMAKIAALGITNPSTATQITNLLLAIIHTLVDTAAASVSQVSSVVLTAIRGLNPIAHSVASSVGEVLLTTIGRLNALGVTSTTQITSILMTLIRSLGFTGVASSALVTQVTISLLVTASISAVSSSSSVGLVRLINLGIFVTARRLIYIKPENRFPTVKYENRFPIVPEED